ncbi:hypothetical protein NQD34_011714 [Periophthalmus magnuspinnatus]|nr:hypothetical protein NQD34_011714 [Periophthalmus magnuspinnatus]
MMYFPVLFLLLVETAPSSAQLNLALRGEATQIDTWDDLGDASNAIDGNRESNYKKRSCTHTSSNTAPWWRLDLHETYAITSIIITNRGDCCPERLDGAEIRVGNCLDNNGNNNPLVATISHIEQGSSKTFTLSQPVKGRYVNVFQPGNNFLTLCEVEVYGKKDETEDNVNLALRGEATQIDTWDDLGDASNAIDGNRESNYKKRSCTHTSSNTAPWWRLDLHETYAITSIIITNRGDCCPERLDGAEIRVGNSLDNNGNNNPLVATISHIEQGSSKNFTLSEPVKGRYVNVFQPGNNFLTLCEVEVYGKKDETEDNVNLALRGEATQIDTWDDLGDASNAIDGNRESNYKKRSCTHTSSNTAPWWRLDLHETYAITSIIITNRGDCCPERLDGAEIRVGNSLDNNGNNNPLVATISHIEQGSSKTFTLSQPVKGRYVNVFQPGNNFLTLCEVEVYGKKDETEDNVNLALRGEATQIDTHNDLGDASNAIDGNRESNYMKRSCTHTSSNTAPWWRLDLHETYAITSIIITNRGDCCPERLDGAEIRVGNCLDNNGNNNPLVATISHIPSGVSKTFKVTGAVEGRYVNVFLPGADKYLTLCEVEVYGYQQEVSQLSQ